MSIANSRLGICCVVLVSRLAKCGGRYGGTINLSGTQFHVSATKKGIYIQ